MGLALNSLFGVEVLPAALGTSRAHEKARRVPHRSAVNLSTRFFPLHARRVSPLEARRELLRVSAFTAMAAALRPTVPSSSCCPTPACRLPLCKFSRGSGSPIFWWGSRRKYFLTVTSSMGRGHGGALRGFTSIPLSCGEAFACSS